MSFSLRVSPAKCTLCYSCAYDCPVGALNQVNEMLAWDKEKCIRCKSCEYNCIYGAMKCYTVIKSKGIV